LFFGAGLKSIALASQAAMALEKNNRYEGDLARLTALAGGALAFFGALLLAVIAFAGWSSNQTAFERTEERCMVG
jgi:hypothetical protein